MATMKHIIDLVIKITRMNKDRELVGPLNELMRGMKGMENDLLMLLQSRTSLTMENAKLKREAVTHKAGTTQQLRAILDVDIPDVIIPPEEPL